MVIVVRIDLDKYTLDMLERLVLDGVVTRTEVREAKAFKAMSEYNQVLWIRRMQAAERQAA